MDDFERNKTLVLKEKYFEKSFNGYSCKNFEKNLHFLATADASAKNADFF